MTVLGKFFEESVKHSSCNDLIHSHTCSYHAVLNLHSYFLSNLKFFAPVILLPPLLKYRRLNEEVIKDSLKYCLEAALSGTAIGWTSHAIMCGLRHLLGEFKLYSFVYIPTFIGALTVMTATPRVLSLYYISIFQSTMESILIRRSNCVTAAMAGSVFMQTLIFMCCSALVLHAKQQGDYKGFWFLIPKKTVPQDVRNVEEEKAEEEKTEEEKAEEEKAEEEKAEEEQTTPLSSCPHEEQNCRAYLVSGVRNYAAIGLLLDTVKMLTTKTLAGKAGLLPKLLAKLRNFEIRSTAFLVSYMGIYRFAHCYLNRKPDQTPLQRHLLAGFLGGACYLFYPNQPLLCYGIVQSTAILWSMLQKAEFAKDNEIFEFVKRIPLVTIMHPFALAYLTHTYCLRGQYISSLGESLLNGCTNNTTKHIQSNLRRMQTLMDSKLQSTS